MQYHTSQSERIIVYGPGMISFSSKSTFLHTKRSVKCKKEVPTFIIQTYTDTHTPYNPLVPPWPPLHFPNRQTHYTNEKQVRGWRRGREGEEEGGGVRFYLSVLVSHLRY